MKGSKFKTVIVYPFDVPEYRSKFVFINRIAIRLAIKDGQAAKRALKATISNIEFLESVVRAREKSADMADTSYMRDYYNHQANEWFEKLMREVRYKLKCRVDMMHHGHRANALENPPQPRSTHDEWVRAHDAARLSRRPYRRPARINQRVAAFDYEDAAEHDVVDHSQLKWQRLVVILAMVLRDWAKHDIHFEERIEGFFSAKCPRCGCYSSPRGYGMADNCCNCCISTDYYHMHDDTHFF